MRRSRRRGAAISLTPLIDVVFILLVFFMLAARLVPERGVALHGAAGGGGGMVGGLMVEVLGAGFGFAGVTLDADALAARLAPLLADDAGRPVFLRPGAEATVQGVADALDLLDVLGAQSVTLIGGGS